MNLSSWIHKGFMGGPLNCELGYFLANFDMNYIIFRNDENFKKIF